MPALPEDQKPQELRRPEVVGVFVNGCVDRGDGSRFRRKAHAHNHKGSKNFGWVCFLSAKRLTAIPLVLHELAHILTPGHGHDDAWREKCLEIGGTLDEVPGLMRDMHKKARGAK